MDLGNDPSPQFGRLQDVRLIDGGHQPPPLARGLKGHMGNACNFFRGIDLGVHTTVAGGGWFNPLRFTKINSTDEFTND